MRSRRGALEVLWTEGDGGGFSQPVQTQGPLKPVFLSSPSDESWPRTGVSVGLCSLYCVS